MVTGRYKEGKEKVRNRIIYRVAKLKFAVCQTTFKAQRWGQFPICKRRAGEVPVTGQHLIHATVCKDVSGGHRQYQWISYSNQLSFHEGNFFCFFSKKGKHVFQLIPIDVLLWKLGVLHTNEDGYYKDKQTSKKQTKKQKISVGEYVEKLEPLCSAGGNAKWGSHCAKQHGGYSKKEAQSHRVT